MKRRTLLRTKASEPSSASVIPPVILNGRRWVATKMMRAPLNELVLRKLLRLLGLLQNLLVLTSTALKIMAFKLKFGSNDQDKRILQNASAAETPSPCLPEESGTLQSNEDAMVGNLPVIFACRTASVKGPAASRTALKKYRASINSELARTLEIVGSYDLEAGYTPLHESVRQGDVATEQFLLIAGAEADAENNANDETPLDLAIDGTSCRDLLERHAAIQALVRADPAALVSAALSYCATLSDSKQAVPTPQFSLSLYQLDPFFLWAPLAARTAVLAWARNAFIIQLAAMTELFDELPDDCSSDVIEYFETNLARSETLCIAKHCSSSKAHAWVRTIVTAAVVTRASEKLLSAAGNGKLNTTRKCLRKGGDVDVEDKSDGTSALTVASIRSHIDVVKLLLNAGADIEAKNYDGDTALMGASCYGDFDTIDVLLKAGAGTDARNKMGYTALIFAARKGRSDIANLLLRAGANKDIKDEDGRTALMFAAYAGDYDCMNLLLNKGADRKARDVLGKTAFDYAEQNCFL